MGQGYWTSEASSFYTFRGVHPQVVLNELIQAWNAEAQEDHMVEYWEYANGWRYSFRTFNVVMYYFKVEEPFVEGHDLAVLLTPHADEGTSFNSWEWDVYQNNLQDVVRSLNAHALPREASFSAEDVARRTTQLLEYDLEIPG